MTDEGWWEVVGLLCDKYEALIQAAPWRRRELVGRFDEQLIQIRSLRRMERYTTAWAEGRAAW
jgi:hypothetical protein